MSGSENYENLMQEVCVEMGWCVEVVDVKPTYVVDFIPQRGRAGAEQSVDLLFRADGMDPVVALDQPKQQNDGLDVDMLRDDALTVWSSSVPVRMW